MFKYGVISDPHFPVFGLNTGKYGPEITLHSDILPVCCNHSKLTSPEEEILLIGHFQWLVIYQFDFYLVLLQSGRCSQLNNIIKHMKKKSPNLNAKFL